MNWDKFITTIGAGIITVLAIAFLGSLFSISTGNPLKMRDCSSITEQIIVKLSGYNDL